MSLGLQHFACVSTVQRLEQRTLHLLRRHSKQAFFVRAARFDRLPLCSNAAVSGEESGGVVRLDFDISLARRLSIMKSRLFKQTDISLQDR